MKNNCQNCYYRAYKTNQEPCESCDSKLFNNFEPELGQDDDMKLKFSEVILLIVFTVFFANVGLILFNLFK